MWQGISQISMSFFFKTLKVAPFVICFTWVVSILSFFYINVTNTKLISVFEDGFVLKRGVLLMDIVYYFGDVG